MSLLITSVWSTRPIEMVLRVGDWEIFRSSSVRNLGGLFDAQPTLMHPCVSSTVKSVNVHLRSLGRVRRYLDERTTAPGARALILLHWGLTTSMLSAGLYPRQTDQQAPGDAKQCRPAGVYLQERPHLSSPNIELHWLIVCATTRELQSHVFGVQGSQQGQGGTNMS